MIDALIDQPVCKPCKGDKQPNHCGAGADAFPSLVHATAESEQRDVE